MDHYFMLITMDAASIVSEVNHTSHRGPLPFYLSNRWCQLPVQCADCACDIA